MDRNKWISAAAYAIIAGCILYISLFIIATVYYPGGSEQDPKSKAFSWIENYWCNLLSETAINGSVNTARPIALVALVVLIGTLGIFWYVFPKQVVLTGKVENLILFAIILSIAGSILLFADFLLSGFHDIIINFITLAGLIATMGTFITLYRLKWKSLLRFGVFNLLLVALNNVLYYGDGLMVYLPVVQKITFLSFLVWICLIEVRVLQQIRR